MDVHSDCGYDHTTAGSRTRHNPVNFTGCLAHVEITYIVETQHILRIRGYFEHNSACHKAVLTRFPPMPLHPSIYQMALTSLKNGSALTDIQEKNRMLMNNASFMGQFSENVKKSYRWLLKASDTCSLYRQYNRIQGVKVNEHSYLNIDAWLDHESPQYNKVFSDAIFHYSARANKDERFEACVATEDMREATWKYGHKSQIILDGTFGVCDKKVLLFIAMGIDEEGRGVPLAFFFFSAPSKNRHTAAGYNTEIIAKLLGHWKDSLGKRNGETFQPAVAITDTDLKERAGLVVIFPRIWLLICKFHLRQSWRNHRNKILKGKTQAHLDVKGRMRRVEEMLVRTTSIEDARGIIQKEIGVLEAMKERGDHGEIAEKGISHLKDYLLDYWTSESLWRSWSDFGRRVAALILNCPLEGVLPTTNHLESFNGLLKRKHLRRWQHGGRRLRLDVLLQLLVSRVLPSIFQQRQMEKRAQQHWEEQMRSSPGGKALLDARDKPAVVVPPIAYFQGDQDRDTAAAELLERKQISVPEAGKDVFNFACYSSLAVASEESPMIYQISLGFDGTGNCNCPDFLQRGGACKHIRAALLRLDQLRHQNPKIPCIHLPSTIEEARILQTRHVASLLTSSDALGPHIDPSSNAIHQAAAIVDEALRETDGVYEEDSEADKVVSVREDDSDNESVVTDASTSESGDIEEEFDFSALLGTARASINDQAVSRTFYDFERMAPKLGEWQQYLRAVTRLSRPQDLDRAVTFRQELDSLSSELSRLIISFDGTASSTLIHGTDTHPLTDSPSPPRTQLKRPRPEIIGPSPEKASNKRKKSHGHH
jgi:hypothetical protein